MANQASLDALLKLILDQASLNQIANQIKNAMSGATSGLAQNLANAVKQGMAGASGGQSPIAQGLVKDVEAAIKDLSRVSSTPELRNLAQNFDLQAIIRGDVVELERLTMALAQQGKALNQHKDAFTAGLKTENFAAKTAEAIQRENNAIAKLMAERQRILADSARFQAQLQQQTADLNFRVAQRQAATDLESFKQFAAERAAQIRAANQEGAQAFKLLQQGSIVQLLGGAGRGQFDNLLQGGKGNALTTTLAQGGADFKGIATLFGATPKVATAVGAIAGGFTLAAAAAAPVVEYIGQAYDRTRQFQEGIGRVNRLLGGTTREAIRTGAALSLIGQGDSPFATITLNQIQANLSRYQDIMAGKLKPTTKDQEFASGLNTLGVNPAGLTNVNDVLMAMSKKLADTSAIDRSRLVQQIGGLFGQDIANIAGFRPENLQRVMASADRLAKYLNEADAKMSENRQVAYTEADNALKAFEASLTRVIGPIDTLAQRFKSEALYGLADVLDILTGRKGVSKQGESPDDVRIVQGLIKSFATMTGTDRIIPVVDYINKLLDRNQGQQIKDREGNPKAPPKTRDEVTNELVAAKDAAKNYADALKNLEERQKALGELMKGFGNAFSSGFVGAIQGAQRYQDQVDKFSAIYAKFLKTPEFLRVTETTMSDGTVVRGSVGAGGSKQKTPSLDTLINQQQTVANLQKRIADTQLDIDIRTQAYERKRASKKGVTEVDTRDYERDVKNLRDKAFNAQVDLKQLSGDKQGALAMVQGQPGEPSAPVPVSTRSYLVHNAAYGKAKKEVVEFGEQFNMQILETQKDIFQQVLAQYADKPEVAGRLISGVKPVLQGQAALTGAQNGLGIYAQIAEMQALLAGLKNPEQLPDALRGVADTQRRVLQVGGTFQANRLTNKEAVNLGLITQEELDLATPKPPPKGKPVKPKSGIEAGTDMLAQGYQQQVIQQKLQLAVDLEPKINAAKGKLALLQKAQKGDQAALSELFGLSFTKGGTDPIKQVIDLEYEIQNIKFNFGDKSKQLGKDVDQAQAALDQAKEELTKSLKDLEVPVDAFLTPNGEIDTERITTAISDAEKTLKNTLDANPTKIAKEVIVQYTVKFNTTTIGSPPNLAGMGGNYTVGGASSGGGTVNPKGGGTLPSSSNPATNPNTGTTKRKVGGESERAIGGPILKGIQYLVGEKGPELIRTLFGVKLVGVKGPETITAEHDGFVLDAASTQRAMQMIAQNNGRGAPAANVSLLKQFQYQGVELQNERGQFSNTKDYIEALARTRFDRDMAAKAALTQYYGLPYPQAARKAAGMLAGKPEAPKTNPLSESIKNTVTTVASSLAAGGNKLAALIKPFLPPPPPKVVQEMQKKAEDKGITKPAPSVEAARYAMEAGLGFREYGGTLYEGQSYAVGEKGPEVLTYRSGAIQLAGLNGPEIIHAQGDGEVLNASETEKVLRLISARNGSAISDANISEAELQNAVALITGNQTDIVAPGPVRALRSDSAPTSHAEGEEPEDVPGIEFSDDELKASMMQIFGTMPGGAPGPSLEGPAPTEPAPVRGSKAFKDAAGTNPDDALMEQVVSMFGPAQPPAPTPKINRGKAIKEAAGMGVDNNTAQQAIAMLGAPAAPPPQGNPSRKVAKFLQKEPTPPPNLFHRASGGPIYAGTRGVVGERGPELIIPRNFKPAGGSQLISRNAPTNYSYSNSPTITIDARGSTSPTTTKRAVQSAAAAFFSDDRVMHDRAQLRRKGRTA